MAKKSYVLHVKEEYIKWRTSAENGDKQPCGTLLVWRRHVIKNIVVPDGVEVIGKGCFGACPLKEFYIAKGTKLDNSDIFYGYGVRNGVPEQIIEY